MSDHCPPREALQAALVKRAEGYEREAKAFRRMAREFAGVELASDTVVRFWRSLSDTTPGMERPPKG